MIRENRVREVQSYDVIHDEENDDLSTETINTTDDNECDQDFPQELISLPSETRETSTPITTFH